MDTLNDSAITLKYKNGILIRKNSQFAFKFLASEIITNESEIIDKCLLSRERDNAEYETLLKAVESKNLNFKKLLKAFSDEKYAFFIWEKDSAIELYDYLSNMKKVNYKLKLEEAASFICQLVVGVNFLHSHKIMHLFLNTTDIYYYTNDILKIGGFYNFEVNKADKKSSNKRNLFYNCPKAELEQVDFKYDNWSLGWILYELCTYETHRLILQTTNFLSFKHPILPKTYRKLQSTFENLSQTDRNRRKDLKELLNAREYLNEYKMQYDRMVDKIEKLGREIKNYVVIQLLGYGAFGITYRVKDKKDNQEKALKMIPESQEDDIKEAKLLMDLKHKNIAECYHYFKEDDSLYLVTELCNGKNLQNYIDKSKNLGNKIAPKRVLDWSRQLFEGIYFAHSKTIIHRDLKPDNIMLNYDYKTETYTLKLIDFGLARKLDGNLQAKTFCGTPVYSAPEIFKAFNAHNPYDHRVDVWSGGCIIFEMIELARAYEAVTWTELISKISDPNHKPKIRNENFMKSVLNLTFVHEYTKRPDSKIILQEINKIKVNES